MHTFAPLLSSLIPTHHPPLFPQVESTLSMQAMQPRVKELQAKYANDPERLQVGAEASGRARAWCWGLLCGLEAWRGGHTGGSQRAAAWVLALLHGLAWPAC